MKSESEETEKVLAEFKLLHGVEDKLSVYEKQLDDELKFEFQTSYKILNKRSKDKREGLKSLKRELEAKRKANKMTDSPKELNLRSETTNLYVCNLPTTVLIY